MVVLMVMNSPIVAMFTIGFVFTVSTFWFSGDISLSQVTTPAGISLFLMIWLVQTAITGFFLLIIVWFSVWMNPELCAESFIRPCYGYHLEKLRNG